MSLTSLLPAPKHAHSVDDPFKSNRYAGRSLALAPLPPIHALTAAGGPIHEPPPYGYRKGFTPKSVGDFGDGGAFPEIHQLQYPLDMGRKENIISQQKVTPLTVDDKGNIKYDMLVRQHARKDQHVYASYKDLVPKMVEEEELEKPSAEEALKQAERTRQALGLLVDASIATAQPKTAKKKKEPIFVRYTPSNQGESYNSGAQQRIIKVTEKPVDPLEPPQFRHKKMPGGPPSPPAPIMHSPPRKITVQDQQNWKIPPCVSNWKNIKGYVIPLDKRLAADGRGLQEAQINDKFAKLSESLFLAERTARKEIEMRADMIRRLQRQQEEVKEQELRNLAARARQAGQAKQQEEPVVREEEAFDEATKETEEDVEARAAREELRKERKRDLKRELRMENMKEDKRGKTRSAREGERDVSEKIALGQAVPTSKDGLMDQRLFNQDQGLESGFGAEDDYNVYDKQLFKGSSANFIYRPKPSEDMSEADVAKLIEKSAGKFKPDRGFKGADKAPTATSNREKPVEFEKDEVDPFNLNVLLTDAHKAPSKHTSLDKIGKTGHMSAAVSGSKDDYSHSRQRTMQFEESSSDDRGKRRKH